MISKVLGVRKLDFTDNNGDPVQGLQLWLSCESPEPDWNGTEVFKLWIPKGHAREADIWKLRAGTVIDVDTRGKKLYGFSVKSVPPASV